MKFILRTFFCCFVAVIALTLCASAADIIDSGTCGDNLTYTLDSDGVLTISGTGAMYDWGYQDFYFFPWVKDSGVVRAIISDGVTSISANAFYGCDSLTSVAIADSVTSIGREAFCSCANLKSVAIPDSVTAIGDYAFVSCASLTNVTIGDSVTFIGDYAFHGCASLTNVTIGDSVTSIGKGAFQFCESLTSVTIPDSVDFIGDGAFSSCDTLTAILIGANNRNYMSEGGVLFNKNRSALLWCPMEKTGAYEIPDGVTHIGDYAFSSCHNLTSVTIPDSVTSIGDYAFSWCDSLTSVKIGDGVTSIVGGAFDGCESLTNVTIPDSVTSIDWGAFYGCKSLTDVYYGGSAAQWKEICYWLDWDSVQDNGLKNATIHYNAKDIGVGITLTDENGETVDGNGQTGETEETKTDAFLDGAKFKASFDAVGLDASSGLDTANVFIIFYDRDGLMVSLESREIDLSNPLSLLFILELRIPEGAKTLKFLMLNDNFEPQRAVRLIESSADAA